MAIHIVKCLYCGKPFDAQPEGKDTIWYKPNAHRYAHVVCGQKKAETQSQEEKDKDELYQVCKRIFGKNLNYQMTKRLTAKYIKEYNYSYSGIARTLIYFYEIKKNPADKGNGSIGIVPYIYNEAYNYYLTLFNAQKVNNNVEYKANVKEITIHAPKYKKKLPKLFDLDFEESKNEQEDL